MITLSISAFVSILRVSLIYQGQYCDGSLQPNACIRGRGFTVPSNSIRVSVFLLQYINSVIEKTRMRH